MPDRYQTDAIYTDFSAAFQSVNHKLLLYKLSESYGIGDKVFEIDPMTSSRGDITIAYQMANFA